MFDPIGQDKEGNEIRLVDIIEQQQEDVVEGMMIAANIRKMLGLIDEVLSEREKEIILMRYGLGGKREYTQNEIGNRLGISRSYVSRIEKKALKKLRDSFLLLEV